MKKIYSAVLAIITSASVYAQNQPLSNREIKQEERKERISQLIRQEEEGALIFHKQNVFGVKLTSDGYGAFYELGRLKTPTITNLYSLEIGERKHPKEEKSPSYVGQFFSNPYIFGKVNNFYYAKLGYAQQRLIGGKGNKNGVAVSGIYGGGFSAGLLKPYYLRITDPGTGEQKDISYQDNEALFLDPSIINGSAGIGKGFSELNFVPGLFAKSALRFDNGRYNEVVSAVEVGIHAEYYTKKMPQMLLNKEKRFFINAYAAIVFGKRK